MKRRKDVSSTLTKIFSKEIGDGVKGKKMAATSCEIDHTPWWHEAYRLMGLCHQQVKSGYVLSD
jgi:hypothetical protein